MNDWRSKDDAARPAPARPRSSAAGSPVWLITGCSSGFGLAVARAAAARGDRVVATARTPGSVPDIAHPDPAGVTVVRLDVLDPTSIDAAVAETVDRYGRIDVLVNNAGTATLGAIEEVGDALLREQLDVNLFGALAVTRAVLPTMRAQGDGHLIHMSSMGGRCAFPGLGAYHASKWGLEGASIALAQEVGPLGIRLTLVEPGDFRTPVLAPGRMAVAEPIDAYAATVGQARTGVAQLDGNQPGDPQRLADAILAVVDVEEPPLHLALGSDCYARLREDLERQLEELERWSALTVSTDYPVPSAE